MISARTKPIRRAFVPAHTRVAEARLDVRHDPADLAVMLRDLAARAHRAVRTLDAATAADTDTLRELAELHPRIVELQHSIDGESQRGLDLYLSALRREVESRLG
jgi:hypothetical protein